MKRTILAAALASVSSYCVLMATMGPSGLAATAHARAAMDDMKRNLQLLGDLNEEYGARWDRLRTSAETVALEGRSMGYIGEDEVVVRLPSMPARTAPDAPGTRLGYAPPASLPESTAKSMAALLGLGVLAAGLARRAPFRRQDRTPGERTTAS